ncbi:MAG: hypothetical protein JXA16_01155 [Bacteroidales bacterium]|nr:hypothetical protein [Bacteroidales bacterium]
MADPRDGIIGDWRVTDNTLVGSNGYDVTISKDQNDKTKILFDNFHAVNSQDKLSATFDGENIIIPLQTLDGEYIFEGEGSVTSTGDKITLNYDFTWGEDATISVVATFGAQLVKKAKTPAVAIN